MRITRRGFLLASLAGPAAGLGYGGLVESGWLELTRRRVPVHGRGLRRDLTILHLSDLHAGSDTPFAIIERAIAMGLDQRPDAAFLTGDYITRGRLPDFDRYGEILRALPATTPTFASFGNHDGGRWSAQEGGVDNLTPIRGMLEGAGIVCLRNEAVATVIAGQRINIVGIGDLWAGDADPVRAFGAMEEDKTFTISLSHNPDTTEMLGAYRWNLQLSGHTHGGQVVVPMVDYPPFVPVEDRRFIKGLHTWKGRHVFITRGVGSLFRIRIACRPEVSILTLEA